MNKVYVTGVGMIPFAKPGASAPYHQMGADAARAALQDAGLGYDDIEQAYAGYVYGDSTCGQKALYGVGMTGIALAYALPALPWIGRHIDRRDHAAGAQVAFRFNSFICLAMADRLGGAQGLLMLAVEGIAMYAIMAWLEKRMTGWAHRSTMGQ